MRTQTCSLMMGAYTQALRSTALRFQADKPFLKTSASLSCLGGAQNRSITTKSKSKSPLSLATMRVDYEQPEHVYASMFPDLPIAEMPVASLVFGESHKWSHKVAIECGLSGRSYKYGELKDATWRWGGFIQRTFEDNAQPPTVAIFSPNTPEYPIVFFGTLAAGGVTTTINAAYTPAEIATHLTDSGASLIVVESIMEPLVDAALQILQKDIPVVVNGPSKRNRPNVRDIIQQTNIPFATDIEYKPDQVVTLPYSSGTTGKPKGVQLTNSFLSGTFSIYHFPYGCPVEKAEGDHQDVIMGLLPFFHIYGMLVIMGSGLARGAKIVTLPKFDPKNYVSVLKKTKMTVLHTVPPLMHFLTASPSVIPEDLSHVHTVMCGAAPVTVDAAMAIKEKAGHPLFFQEGFGMTEVMCSHLTPIGGEKIGSCGKLMPNASAKLVDLSTGASVPLGVKGELCVKSACMMKGYHNNPKATAETIDEDGWFHTGDVATCDEEGYFYIVDRIKELIKVKGLQVAPSELEEIIMGHPGVGDVGVIGVPNERAGEVPMAYIVPRQKNLSADDIHSFLEDRVARHKKLVGGIRFVQELPKNATGKLMRRQLQKMAEEEE